MHQKTLLLLLSVIAALASFGIADETAQKETAIVTADNDGSFSLTPALANFRTDVAGGTPKVVSNGSLICLWGEPKDWVSWKIKVPAPGTYTVIFTACSPGDSEANLLVSGSHALNVTPEKSNGWGDYKTWTAGKITFEKEGEYEVSLHPKEAGSWSGLDVQMVTLKKAD